MKEYNLKQFAHIGDAVFELFIRENVINQAETMKMLHSKTIQYVNAEFQSRLLEILENELTEEEKSLTKRGLNLPLTSNKKNNQNTHRHATAFEVLIGKLYLTDKTRLNQIFEIIKERAL